MTDLAVLPDIFGKSRLSQFGMVLKTGLQLSVISSSSSLVDYSNPIVKGLKEWLFLVLFLNLSLRRAACTVYFFQHLVYFYYKLICQIELRRKGQQS